MECPRCGVINIETAPLCDCGYAFQGNTNATAPSLPTPGGITQLPMPLPRIWIGFVLVVLSLVTAIIEAFVNPEFIRQESPVGFYLLFLIGAWIYWLWCVHRYHDIMLAVPGYRHPISPGQAVARHFIPFYNFYWVFKWPSQIATFVNWRAQANVMQGWIAGLLVLGAMILGRVIDGSVGLVLLFGCGIYISRQIQKAFAAPPVPPSAMAPPGAQSVLGLS
jgi:hypothetical protein